MFKTSGDCFVKACKEPAWVKNKLEILVKFSDIINVCFFYLNKDQTAGWQISGIYEDHYNQFISCVPYKVIAASQFRVSLLQRTWLRRLQVEHSLSFHPRWSVTFWNWFPKVSWSFCSTGHKSVSNFTKGYWYSSEMAKILRFQSQNHIFGSVNDGDMGPTHHHLRTNKSKWRQKSM